MEEAGYSVQEHCKPPTNQDPFPTPKRKTKDNSKRFSDEQVKSLESMFNRGAKLEPRNKMLLANDLGLQPRQVSIWFQNKRARWKSKKLEQEYRVLKANFDDMYHQFESLKKENESLIEQLHTINSLLEESSHRRQSSSSKDSNENARNAGPEIRDKHMEHTEDVGQKDQPEIEIVTEQGESSSGSRKPWCNLVSGGLLDESCCPSSWWDF